MQTLFMEQDLGVVGINNISFRYNDLYFIKYKYFYKFIVVISFKEYNIFKSEAIKSINLKENSFGIEPEITMKLAKKNFIFYEVSKVS